MATKSKFNHTWPVLTKYDQDHLDRISLPLGGIGTGTVGLGGRGDLRDWEIVNRPAKGFSPGNAFFTLYAKPSGKEAVTRAIEGPIEYWRYEGHSGSTAPNHGLPRFRKCSFAAAYPFGQVALSDQDVPLDARIEAFNPLVPADADTSGIPVAILRFELTNKTSRPVAASVCASLNNFIGTDGHRGKAEGNVNTFRKTSKLRGVFMESEEVDPKAEQFGTIALTTTARAGVTYSTRRPGGGGRTLLDFWDDFSADGKLTEPEPGVPCSHLNDDLAMASLAVSVRVPPRGSKTVTFLLTWHFPNRQTWTPVAEPECCDEGAACTDPNRVGNYYTTQYADAWDAAEKTAARLKKLEADTLAFVRTFCECDLPAAVKEAALYTLTALRSQTSFRTEDGRFFGFEGCGDTSGSCHGSCTHVWNYEQATAFLFGDLARMMREVEFIHATDETGMMNFRVGLPLERAREAPMAAADGQMGCLMKLYRDWQLSGDDDMLRALWPKARKAIEYCWLPGGWDADRDGVMEGCQHNTMDVEYYGPNPQMGGWYLGALRATEEMARYLGEEDFAATCRDLFERGSKWMDENLFNGEYYEHQIRPPGDGPVAHRLRWSPPKNPDDPDFQLGSGCLIDQVVGQYMAHICGLDYLLDRNNVRKALRSVKKYNFKKNFFNHFNNMRTFALNDESAMIMASFPRGNRPQRPFPYYNEVMTGFEYTAAVGMLYEGQDASAMECINAVRNRYDGKRRSPFNEAECGHYYARAMASWAAVLALTGFRYSGVDAAVTFAPADKPTRVFWSNGTAWGTCAQKPSRAGIQVELNVLHGKLKIKKLVLTGLGAVELPKTRTLAKGRAMKIVVTKA